MAAIGYPTIKNLFQDAGILLEPCKLPSCTPWGDSVSDMFYQSVLVEPGMLHHVIAKLFQAAHWSDSPKEATLILQKAFGWTVRVTEPTVVEVGTHPMERWFFLKFPVK